MAKKYHLGKLWRVATVDLNADLGEGCGSDDELLDLVSSASIACGAHAGDEGTMLATIESAMARGVSIGAHPGYPDRESFGRAESGAPGFAIADMVRAQLDVFAKACSRAGAAFTHVKPHGAMYNRAMHDKDAADAIARAVSSFDASLVVLGMPGSALLAACKAVGLGTAREAFLDRAYASATALAARGAAGAVITDPARAAKRAEEIAVGGYVTAIDGTKLGVRADSLCVHGDHPHAVSLLRAARERLQAAGVTIAPFRAP